MADLRRFGPSYCNDMVVDEYGRADVGHSGSGLLTQGTRGGGYIVLVTPDGQARVVAEIRHAAGEAPYFRADVSRWHDVHAMMQAAMDQYGT